MELINCNNARVFCCFFLLSLFLDALVHWLVTLLDFHCFDVFGPLQSVHRAITNSFQIFIYLSKMYFSNLYFSKLQFLKCTQLLHLLSSACFFLRIFPSMFLDDLSCVVYSPSCLYIKEQFLRELSSIWAVNTSADELNPRQSAIKPNPVSVTFHFHSTILRKASPCPKFRNSRAFRTFFGIFIFSKNAWGGCSPLSCNPK